jgi:DNA topoisomerase-1
VTKGKEAPLPPKGHKWGGIVHDDTARWTAKYRDKITKRLKYILLAETGDLLKFEKARKLNKHIDEIEKRISSLLKSKDSKENQIGCVLYLIKEYGLRVGNEKEDDEDDDDKSEKVVGATTLLVQHVCCKIDNASHNLVLSFKGKDSVSYDGMISVSEAVYKHVEKFLKGKKPYEPRQRRLLARQPSDTRNGRICCWFDIRSCTR